MRTVQSHQSQREHELHQMMTLTIPWTLSPLPYGDQCKHLPLKGRHMSSVPDVTPPDWSSLSCSKGNLSHPVPLRTSSLTPRPLDTSSEPSGSTTYDSYSLATSSWKYAGLWEGVQRIAKESILTLLAVILDRLLAQEARNLGQGEWASKKKGKEWSPPERVVQYMCHA